MIAPKRRNVGCDGINFAVLELGKTSRQMRFEMTIDDIDKRLRKTQVVTLLGLAMIAIAQSEQMLNQISFSPLLDALSAVVFLTAVIGILFAGVGIYDLFAAKKALRFAVLRSAAAENHEVAKASARS